MFFRKKGGRQSMLCFVNSPSCLQESRSSSATGFVERKVFLYYRILNVLHALSVIRLFLFEISFFTNIVLKMRKCFRKAWESGSSGLSSFLGRYFS